MSDELIRIPEEYFIGFRKTSSGVDAKITPNDNVGNLKARQDTVKNWSKELDTKKFSNKPMHGFMIDDLHYTSSSTKFTIKDPRGFDISISCENFLELMQNSTIQNGEIIERCIWARKTRNDWLITENSENYERAVRITELLKNSPKPGTLIAGNTVTTTKGQELVYLGTFHPVYYDRISHNVTNMGVKTTGTLEIFQDLKKNRFVLFKTKPKLIAITNTSTITDEEAEALVNKDFSLKNFKEHNGSSVWDNYLAFTKERVKQGDIEIKLQDTPHYDKSESLQPFILIVPNPNSPYNYLIQRNTYRSNGNVFRAEEYDRIDFEKTGVFSFKTQVTSTYWNHQYTTLSTKDITITGVQTLTPFVEFKTKYSSFKVPM